MLDHLDVWERAVRRPVWPLRLGRSQDLASARARRITLEEGPGHQGHALLPVEASTSGMQLRMPHAISTDRSRIQWGTYRYAPAGSPSQVDSQLRTRDGQAVVPLVGLHPHAAHPVPVELPHIWAKSPQRGEKQGEALTTHLDATTRALRVLRTRIGDLPGVPGRFWEWARLACLFHDAGKVPEGFQTMVGNPPPAHTWGQRHEICSLAFIDHVLAHLPEKDRTWIGLGALTHHRPLAGGEGSIRGEYRSLGSPDEVAATFGPVDASSVNALAQWLAHRAGAPDPDQVDEAVLAKATHRLLEHLLSTWQRGESPTDEAGLTAALLQGAITLADHVASAHGQLLTTHPLTSSDYPRRLRTQLTLQGEATYPHQDDAETVPGHVVVRAPTGQGKTEAALLWATTQTRALSEETGATPRLFYSLPYLASINAMATRLGQAFGSDQIGVVHSRAASYYLATAACDDNDHEPAQSTNEDEERQRRHASRAVAKANASRLFRELVRVTTPYQLLRGALGGTAHASTLIDTANSTFVFDEMHAYEPGRLGMILAMMGQWERLGGRIGIVSATMPQQLTDAIGNVLTRDITTVTPRGDDAWPRRHRLHLREDHLTSEESIAEIEQSLTEGHSVAVIANNVADAWHLYDRLAPTIRRLHGEDAALLLHSRFKTGDRTRIEKRIHDRFRSGRQPRQPGLLVATQVVEVSLDVDFDVLHTSAAPLDALLQRFGRTNRLSQLPDLAPVVVHRPIYAPRAKGGPEFADKVYDAEPTRLAWEILARHDGAALDERLFTDWLNQVYATDWGKQWRAKVDDSVTTFTNEFLDFLTPLNDTSELSDAFDEMFDGVDGILTEDRNAYEQALTGRIDGEERGTGPLLASQYLIPLPHYARHLGTWDRTLNVLLIDAVYKPDRGLTAIHPVHGTAANAYQPGVLL
ncbi:CRISPR-associated helicase Cas3' [Nocardiopsis sp. CNR-923]|uniref:CRISPR-associated helicase Cas3' n=1 Tax=Nocardiopsis sp. CNR-923 TaxID=1904965 RepID=UPI000ABDBCD6|nr:CRISPR-associated helicase Cas3' [Nocardiopsis sp. CNR-923]